MFMLFSIIICSSAANAGTNKAAKSGPTLNTRKLDDDTENLAREFKSLASFC